MAACLLMGLYVRFELSYDDFHANGDRIYRAVEEAGFRPEDVAWNASVTGLLAPTARTEYAGVADAVRMKGLTTRMRREADTYADISGYFAESNLFNIFSFDLQRGDPATALDRPQTVVLSQSLAARIFGNDDPMGQTLRVGIRDSLRTVEVTGVMADVPSNSHLQFDVLVSFDTLLDTRLSISANQFLTYVLLEEEHPPVEALGEQILTYNRETLGKDYVKDARLQPLSAIYFGAIYAPQQGDLRYVYVFSAIAVIILLIACANYMNLATARSIKRTREVGVRKTMGAHRAQLTRQFLGESLLLTLLALPLALGLLALALPAFNSLAGTDIELALLSAPLVPALVGVALVVGLVAGSYPALFLARFRPTQVLTGRLPVGWSGARLRKALIVGQFALSAALLFGTAIILQQLDYIQTKKLGFDQEQVVTMELRDPVFRQQADAFKQEIARLPGVQHAALSLGAPTVGGFGRMGHVFDWKSRQVAFQRALVDADFLETMGIELAAGRNFTRQEVSAGRENPMRTERSGLILNEAAVEALGWASPEAAIGRVIEPFGENTVIGVVEDFHYRSLRHRIEPLALEPGGYAATAVVRLAPGNVAETLDRLRATWDGFASAPFAYQFLDQQIDRLYRAEQRTATIIGGFAGLAVLLACLGLFGLAAYAAERRTKEVGIRKALGASVANIVGLLSKEFLVLVAIACVIAAPVAYGVAQQWLQDFAYRIDVSPLVFVAASALALAIAWGTIGTQAVRAARTDPADALRYE
jgi:putative ABC transport system permease protein